MMFVGKTLVGIAVGLTGWIFAVVTCLLPMWRVTVFRRANHITSPTFWEGIWMSCVVQSTGKRQCKVYDSILALPSDVEAARTMTVVSIITALLALLISTVGAKSPTCIRDEVTNRRAVFISGVLFIIAGILVLIPVSWTSNRIIQDIYMSGNYMYGNWSTELGPSLYTGFTASALLVAGGSFLCCICRPWTRR
ncbi:claudin-4-like [Salminus brasiliensis]|uniref:claudin-4-like n=1 Tax=Salminus brasiliensis TaxID=930266 RepID=UPI003B83104C